MEYHIRELRKTERKVLDTFLYEAIFIPEGAEAPAKEIIHQPELQVYVENFGQKEGDICFVAEVKKTDATVWDLTLMADVETTIVGAVWVRIMDDYGHVDEETPSLAISILREYRHDGIGTKLMETILAELRKRSYKQISLSVQKANYAVSMYQKTGFRIVDETEEEYIMVCPLS